MRSQVLRAWRPLEVGVVLVLGGGFAQAQTLNQTQWYESLSVNADEASINPTGLDDAGPDRLSESLDGSSWSVDADISFGPPGPPQVTTQANGTHDNGLAFFLGSTAYVMISFEFRLSEVVSPPVTISQVPLAVYSKGTATASGDPSFFATAFAFLDMGSERLGPIVSLEARASNNPSDELPASDSFDQWVRFSIPPDEVVFGSMAANAHVSAEVPQDGIAAGAEAFIDPIIEVADEIIPGTSVSYRDVYEVEVSDGFFALGDPTSVQHKDWGAIKALYRTESSYPAR